MNRVTECRLWILTALSALAVAGVFALLLVLSRTPGLQSLFDGANGSFFHKGLVTHVVFSFVVWFLCVYAVLVTWDEQGRETESRLAWPALVTVWAGFVGLSIPALTGQGNAELNNYVPVMNHLSYTIGLWLVFVGIGLIAGRRLTRRSFKKWGGIEYSGTIYVTALLAFGIARLKVPMDWDNANYQEHLYWAGGHILQFFNTGLILLVWLLMTPKIIERDLISGLEQKAMFIVLLSFSVLGLLPLLLGEIGSVFYQGYYTDLLRFGLPIPITFFSIYLFFALLRFSDNFALERSALGLSLGLFLLGGVMGILLDGPDTRVPAHYHATIGGINMAVMAFFFHCALPYVGITEDVVLKKKKWIRAQYWLYGLGQLFHASGLFLAGFLGVMRKTGGEAQGLDSLEKIASMVLMGIGGITSVLGGALFVILMFSCLRKRNREFGYA